ncbi:MAG: hypothetical protein GY725_22830 [bacterium]|nr:hypothetical protein [bacterium]
MTAIPQPAVAQMTPAEPLIDAEPLPAEFLPNEALSGEPLAAQPAAHAAPIAQNPNWVEENPNLLTDLPNTDFNAPSALPHAHAGATPAIQPLVEDPNAVPSLSGLPTPDSEEFSFEDLEFGDAPTTNTDTGVFGAASESPAPAVDYSETTFLDPQTSLSPLPPVAPMQEAPAWQPDPLADTIPEDPFANTNDDSGSSDLPLLHRSAAFAPARPEDDTAVEGARAGQPIAEAVPWPDPEPAPSTAPADFAPVQMSTDAALLEAEPMFSPIADTDTVPVPALPTPVEPLHAEPLAEEPLETEPWETEPLEAEPLDAMPLDTQPLEGGPLMIEPELEFDTEQDIAAGQRSPEGSFEAAAARLEADTALPSTEDLFAPEPAPEGNLNPLPQGIHLDPADVRNAIEKVAWEAFGAVQEQLMREVTARTEAAIWEIVPQLAERLVREEIARLKADVDE